jgi:hypothetical protein
MSEPTGTARLRVAAERLLDEATRCGRAIPDAPAPDPADLERLGTLATELLWEIQATIWAAGSGEDVVQEAVQAHRALRRTIDVLSGLADDLGTAVRREDARDRGQPRPRPDPRSERSDPRSERPGPSGEHADTRGRPQDD